MSFFEKIGLGYLTKEGKGKDYPTGGPALFFSLIGTHFWTLLSLNLIFILFCIPIVTIPAALSGMDRVLLLLIRKGHCFLWPDFWEEFRKSFWRSLLIGVMTVLGLAVSYYLVNIGQANSTSIYGMIFLAIGFFLAFFFIIPGYWFFVLNPLIDLPATVMLKNARLLSIVEWRKSLIVLLVSLLSLIFILWLFPISIIIYLLLLISFTQYIICWFLNSSIQKRVISPYEQQQEQKQEKAEN